MATSPVFAVSNRKNQWLIARMAELGVIEDDLEERFIRSSGRGGQHLNKTSSAVHVRHLPTGLEARYGNERSQSLNRFMARRELLDKIAVGHGLSTAKTVEAARASKQKNRRRRRTAKKMQPSNDTI